MKKGLGGFIMYVLPVFGHYQNTSTKVTPSFKAQSPLLKQAKIINGIISQNLLNQAKYSNQVEQAFVDCDKFISNASKDTVESFCRLALGKKGSQTIQKISENNQIIKKFISTIEDKLGKKVVDIFK